MGQTTIASYLIDMGWEVDVKNKVGQMELVLVCFKARRALLNRNGASVALAQASGYIRRDGCDRSFAALWRWLFLIRCLM